VAGLTDGLEAILFAVEPRDYTIPRVEARQGYDGDCVVGLHHAFGVELLAEWAAVEFAGFAGGRIDAVTNVCAGLSRRTSAAIGRGEEPT
jgi:hypothetical protein